jgi:integrase
MPFYLGKRFNLLQFLIDFSYREGFPPRFFMQNIGLLNAANGRLKRDRIPVRICDRSNWLYLEATLPPAPRSRKLIWHQQRIALRLPIRPDTISIAEKRSRQLAKELAEGIFDWSNWQGRPIVRSEPSAKPISELIADFRSDYFSRRAENPQSLRTWKDYQGILDRLPQNQPIGIDILLEIVRTTKPDTKTRQRACLVLGMLARFARLEIDLGLYRGKYGKKLLTPRDLPTDSQIREARDLIDDAAWGWVFGVLAVYGLRPHEVMRCNLSFPKIDVLDGKTGARVVYPCPEEWVSEWRLETVRLPQISGADNSAIGNRISHAFKRFQIPFRPSDLRHCWAIRSARFYTIDESAKMMGHSSGVHLDVYRYWISDDRLRSAFENSRGQPSDV